MPPNTRKRQAAPELQSKSKRSKKAVEGDDLEENPVESRAPVNSTDDQGDEEAAEEVSTQSIAELQNNFTNFIRHSGKNDGWPATFKEHVHQREGEVVQRLKAGMLERKQEEISFLQAFRPFLAGCLAPVGVRPCDHSTPFPLKFLLPPAEFRSGTFSIKDDDSLYWRHPLHAKTATLLTESRALLSSYSALLAEQQKSRNQDSNTSTRERLIQRLEGEEKTILNAITAGKRVARATIDAKLKDTRTRSAVDVENGANSQGSKILMVGAAELNEKKKPGDRDNRNGVPEQWRTVANESIVAIERLSNVADPPGYAERGSK